MGDQPKRVRTARSILQDAYDELVTREARLAPLEAELLETRGAIAGLSQLLDTRELKILHKTSASDLKPGELTKLVINVCRNSLELLTKDQIAEKLNRESRGVAHALNAAVKQGELVNHEGLYGVTSVKISRD